jgi:hypothetical protein
MWFNKLRSLTVFNNSRRSETSFHKPVFSLMVEHLKYKLDFQVLTAELMLMT